jgi:hypothetical protein
MVENSRANEGRSLDYLLLMIYAISYSESYESAKLAEHASDNSYSENELLNELEQIHAVVEGSGEYILEYVTKCVNDGVKSFRDAMADISNTMYKGKQEAAEDFKKK